MWTYSLEISRKLPATFHIIACLLQLFYFIITSKNYQYLFNRQLPAGKSQAPAGTSCWTPPVGIRRGPGKTGGLSAPSGSPNRFVPTVFTSSLTAARAVGQVRKSSPLSYSSTLDTTPAPTVLPPSLMANRIPSSIAIGVISFIVMVMLSPGMHISTPSGKVIVPVTSVVLK